MIISNSPELSGLFYFINTFDHKFSVRKNYLRDSGSPLTKIFSNVREDINKTKFWHRNLCNRKGSKMILDNNNPCRVGLWKNNLIISLRLNF